MNTIRLHFVSQEQLSLLLEDDILNSQLEHLNPVRVNNNILEITDNVDEHTVLDSEVVILTIFANAIKRILYSETETQIEFLNPFANQQKRGLRHDNLIIIDQTRF